MGSGPGQTQRGSDEFVLEARSVEELKEKAIAAKERAYCTCSLFSILPFHLLHRYRISVVFHLHLLSSDYYRKRKSKNVKRERAQLFFFSSFFFTSFCRVVMAIFPLRLVHTSHLKRSSTSASTRASFLGHTQCPNPFSICS